MEPDFTRTDEQELIAQTARRFLTDRSPLEQVRKDMERPERFDPDLWTAIVEMGWPGLAIGEDHGGAGYGPAEVAVVMEEAGRSLVCAPLLSTAVLTPAALGAADPSADRDALLGAVATGSRRGTVALGHGDAATPDALTGRRDGDAVIVDGDLALVVDGHTADAVVVPLELDGEVVAGVVDGEADGLERNAADVLDQTRALADLRFRRVRIHAGQVLAGDGAHVFRTARLAGLIALASEQVGGARAVLAMSTAYAKERTQFGRAIGSFQAVKHRLAEMLVRIEAARSVAGHAAAALAAADADEIAVMAPMAAAFCGEVYREAAADAIQIHGGIGFTWEHDAHLYLKRATASTLLFGAPAHHRRALGDVLEL